MTEPLFNVLFGYRQEETSRKLRAEGVTLMVIGIPWAMMVPHEAQANTNHSQTLKRLNERGGLSACEAMAVLEDRRYRQMSDAQAHTALAAAIADWNRMQGEGHGTEF